MYAVTGKSKVVDVTGDAGGTGGAQPPPGWSPPGAPQPWGAPGQTPWSAPPPPSGTWPQGWGAPAPQYPWGAEPDPPKPTNPWAVVALVTGIVALVPVAVAAGITALVQIRRRHQGGSGLAIAGLATAGGWTVIGLVATAVFLLADSVGDSGELGRVADAGSTQVGTCLREPEAFESVATAVDCVEEHDAEVYLVEVLDGAAWPGYDRVLVDAEDSCYFAFEGYVGESYDFSLYEYGYFMPDQAEWEAGERRVVCVVLPGISGRLDGSVRGSSE